MCGIVGLISKNPTGFWSTHVDIFTDMLVMDQLRGMDGTGVFGVYKNRQAFLTKAGTHASNFVMLKDYAQFKERMSKSMNMVFGHNRKATVGKVSSVNSHPFLEDNILLLHNGFIQNASSFDPKADVDSQALARGLNKGDAKDIMSRVQGAYALVWYDKRDKTLRIARNSERPLWAADSDNFMAFASEPWTLFAAAHKTRRSVEVKLKDCAEVETHKIYEFTPNGDLNIVEYSPTARSYSNRGGVWWEGEDCGYYHHNHNVVTSNTTPTVVHNRRTDAVETTPSLRNDWDKAIRSLPNAGEEVSFRIKNINLFHMNGEKRFRVYGDLSVNKQVVDFNGEIDWAETMEEVNGMVGIDYNTQRWLHATVEAKGVTSSGPWVRVKDIFAPAMITTWNKCDVPQFIWDRIVKSCKCSKCSSSIQSKEAPYTSVNMTTGGDVTKVVCGTCVVDAFERDQNAKTSGDSSVQVGQSVSPSTLH